MSRRRAASSAIAAGTDYTTDLMSPFPVLTVTEAERYRRWRVGAITTPRVYNDDFLEQLGIWADIEEYLTVLGVASYATLAHVSSTVLTREFLTTLSIAPDYTWLKFRLQGVERRLTLTQLSRVIGSHSPSVGVCSMPTSFNPNATWHELTGFDHWRSGGLSSGFIRDPGLAILHKFVAYGISGNYEANKINTHELFLLDCARRGIRVCAASFLIQTLHHVLTNQRCRPTLPMLVSAIAFHFQVTPETAYPDDTLIHRVMIDFRELKSANILTSQRQWFPVDQRACVVNHRNALLAAEHGMPFNADDDAEEGGEDAQPTHFTGPSSSRQHNPGFYSSDFAQFRADFGEWRDEQAQHWASIQTTQQSILTNLESQGTRLDNFGNRLDSFDTRLDSLDTRLTEQNQLWTTANLQSAEHYRQVMDNNRMMAELNTQWSNWALFDSQATATPPSDPMTSSDALLLFVRFFILCVSG